MGEKSQSKGIQSKQKKIVVVPVKIRMANKFMSKAAFKERRQKDREANAAADAARARVLAERGVNEEDEKKTEQISSLKGLVAVIKKDIKVSKAYLSEKPDSKKEKVKLGKLNEQLDEAENNLDELENG